MIKVAVLGYGNIGSGVVQVLLKNKETIAKKAGDEIVPACVLDLRDFPGDVMEDKVVKDINLITQNPEISIVVETMGGTKPAYAFVKACLEAGKHVATSNKELVAAHGPELLEIAKAHHVSFLFEASVGGGIPIIRPLVSSITSDAVTEITGILNGTTNYMLTKMSEDGLDYDAVLEDAQERGYAERNPAADVEGHDARRKIAILSSLAFGKYVDYEDVYTEGITKITSADFAYAKVLGSRIKLFGTSKKKDDGSISTMVCPVMITNEHPLFAVNDVMNAILVRGESMGDLMFYGAGAGKLPTASAVVADVVNAARNPKITEIAPYEPGKMTVSDHLKSTHSYFVRVKGSDANAVAESFKAKQIVDAGIADEFGLITAEWAENEFDALCENYPVVSVIRLAK
ncbi:MAG: homoserine dehydrogenase [Lachnospiraceae bacterium]